MTMKRRCAIYTRKSTEEGLEQAFNSLDAQREACAAYILSQTHEGWELVDEQYDDGGWSGGNMERPGLKQLLADVAAGKVDVIVVYKVDRLTRSLADFARIVDTLDKAKASFVSVTQAFNTTSSMGRLTLNVLLSFAQFEREVTSERIRDKFAASKRKGIFMGGPIPIGYRLEDRKLIIDEVEARTVRIIFERYTALRSIGQLVDELALRGFQTKVRQMKNGRVTGGVPFCQGPLAALLKNPLYIGKVAYGGALHEGEHEAIIDDALWTEVQSLIASNRHRRKFGLGARNPSLLTGMLTDPDGVPMTPTFTTKGSQRHHYYVTRLKPGEDRKNAWRVPAREVDRGVIAALKNWLRSSRGTELSEDVRAIRDQLANRRHLATAISDMSIAEQRQLLFDFRVTVQLGTNQLSLRLGDVAEAIVIELPARLAHRGPELKLILLEGVDQAREPDRVLIKLMALARVAQQALMNDEPDPLISHYSKRHLWQLLRISWLAPDIITAIIGGTQPATLTGRRLLRATDIPLDWKSQRAYFQFG
ncbi:recombinase family protein [Sphingomonas sp.]|uniref:recombinase family protein n=1 Tax=Sphingomonas sp. TaxID=28214 RepID=UPI00286E7F0B|nr:recombinase family protein [Sphingomonas sp.]